MTDSPNPATADDIYPGVTAIARAALEEFTPADTIGDVVDFTLSDDGVLTLRFEPKMLGYPGWSWTVDAVQLEGEAPTVLEADLIPGDGALLAPDWVPWAQRLAEYRAAQQLAEEEAALAAAAASDDDDDDDLDDDDEDDEFDPQDDDEKAGDPDAARLHSGDLDGVDIDELDPDADFDEVEDDEVEDDEVEDDEEEDDEEE